MRNFFISISELQSRIGTEEAPAIFDVRRRPLFDSENTILPTARWRDHTASELWGSSLGTSTDVVIHCVHGHNVSQAAAASLRSRGVEARVLEGGIEGWREAGGPLIVKDALPHRDEDVPSVWVTATEPHIDQLSCAWLVNRFIERNATFLFVEPDHVVAVAEELGGISFGVPDATIAGADGGSVFGACLARFGLTTYMHGMSNVIDGAVTEQTAPAPEVAGVSALVTGSIALADTDERDMVQRSRPLFDALYAWQVHAVDATRSSSA